MSRRALSAAALILALAPAPAPAHPEDDPVPPRARIAQNGTVAPCPGDPIRTDRVITGTFGPEQLRSYVMVPFEVPAGTTAVRVKYCYDQPEAAQVSGQKHTIDLGLWGPGAEFRGWGGSSHPDVTVSPEGFSPEERYRAAPKAHVPGKTTRGFLPGPIKPGTWEAELGVAAVIDRAGGDLDGRVAWRVEIELSSDAAFADEPYVPAAFGTAPVRRGQGWYTGDLHVHAEHSALGDATIREVADHAFGAARLDFVTFSDYVTPSAWGELGRHQERYGGKLLARSSEIITYRGHTNNHVSLRYVDHRTGPVLAWTGSGTTLRRGPRPPRELFREVHATGGFTQVNHPTIFPSSNPAFRSLCRGCSWDYSEAETDWAAVDAFEVHTGPPIVVGAPNPFTLTAIAEYDRLWRAGYRPAAVGVSDAHKAGRVDNPVTQAPVGTGATVVRAPELSEHGLRSGVLAGRTYAKVLGPGSSDVRAELVNAEGSATFGGSLPGRAANLRVTVTAPPGEVQRRTLELRRDGRVVQSTEITGREWTRSFTIPETGHWRLQVMRGTAVDVVTTPITLGRAPDPEPVLDPARPAPRLRAKVRPRTLRAGRRTPVRVRVTALGHPVRGALVRLGRFSARTDDRGRATVRARFASRGTRRVRVSLAGHRSVRIAVRVARR